MMLAMLASCDKDKFAEINQNPELVTKANIGYLFTEALYQYDQTYTEWYYDNSKYIFPWTQVTVSSSGNTGDIVLDGGAHGARNATLYGGVMRSMVDIRFLIDTKMTQEERAQYQHIRAMSYLLQIAQAIKVTDIYGSMAYTEACLARYSTPRLLTPKYENQQELFDIWLRELNEAIKVLGADKPVVNGVPTTQINIGKQDFVYGCDRKKWMKYANGLKLRIAARMINVDKNRAIALASEVGQSEYPSDNSDDFYYSPAVNYYHFGDNVGYGAGSKNLIDFLRDNQDPRLRFLFEKNDFNSIVVQGFFDAGKELPSYIDQLVDYTTEVVAGKNVKKFKGWKAPGEPWVRYFGAPAAPDARNDADIKKNYFDSAPYKLGDKVFSKLSFYNAKNVTTHSDYTYPDPSKTVKEEDNVTYHACHMSAAEINLYLAEFKLLGATLNESAEFYYKKAIETSVNLHDRIARENKVAYYSKAYDPNEATIELKSGEIANLLEKSAYKLTGTVEEKLEKVYIQEYINFLSNPNELFVTSRRSGYPKYGSSVFAREPFLEGGKDLTVPRRFSISNPTVDNINYSNIVKAIKDQGFTTGSNDPELLNKERVWYDQKAPQWGVGIK